MQVDDLNSYFIKNMNIVTYFIRIETYTNTFLFNCRKNNVILHICFYEYN